MRKQTGGLLFVAAMIVGVGAMANNGVNLIGASAASVALGGTGTANYLGATDALFKNSALLGSSADAVGEMTAEAAFTWIAVSSKANLGSGEGNSTYPGRFVPEIAISRKASDSIDYALGILGTSGGGVRYTDTATLARISTDLTVARLALGVSYKLSQNFSLGFSPFLGYGEFALNSNSENGGGAAAATTRKPPGDLAFGWQLGAAFTPVKNVHVGVSYTSKVPFTYKEVTDFAIFGATPTLNGADNVDISQPCEFGVGVAIQMTDSLKVTADGRLLRWSKAEGYSEFGWTDQGVVALGVQYQIIPAVAFRLGWNHAEPVYADNTSENPTGTVTVQGNALTQPNASTLNIAGFPAIAQNHFTFGAGYALSEGNEVGLALMFSPNVTATKAGAASAYTFTTTTSQWSATLGAKLRM